MPRKRGLGSAAIALGAVMLALIVVDGVFDSPRAAGGEAMFAVLGVTAIGAGVLWFRADTTDSADTE